MERRKVTYKLYPNVAQTARLEAWVRLHCELYNVALQERIEAYRKAGKSISYYDQQNVLPERRSGCMYARIAASRCSATKTVHRLSSLMHTRLERA